MPRRAAREGARGEEGLHPVRQGDLRPRRRQPVPQREEARHPVDPGSSQAWDKDASSYEAIATQIKATGADGVFLGGIICNNGGKLIKDLRAGNPGIQILAPDGFTPISATIELSGEASEGTYITQPGVPPDQLEAGEGQQFVTDFTAERGKAPNPYTAYAAQATVVLLDAIEASDGSRGSVSENLFNLEITDSILGDFEIDENGDTTLGIVSVYQIKGQKETFVKTITPELSF